MLLCDPDGVPRLVQNIKYRYGSMTVLVTYFDGRLKEIPVEVLTDSVGLLDKSLSTMQYLEIEAALEKVAWSKM